MEHEVLDTTIEGYGEYGSIPVRAGEQVFLYRRLQDAYDPALVCVINEMNEALGYLNRDIAITVVLPALKEGVRFQCVVQGDAQDDQIPIQVMSMEQAEVTAILERRGGLRRGGASVVPPLAGVFDDEELDIDDDDDDLEEPEAKQGEDKNDDD